MERTDIRKKRPSVLEGPTVRAEVPCGTAYITVNTEEDCLTEVLEVFSQIGKSGQCVRVQSGAMCRLASHALRAGVAPEKVMMDMLGETCDRWDGNLKHPRSCSDAIGRAIGFMLGKFDKDLQPIKEEGDNDGVTN